MLVSVVIGFEGPAPPVVPFWGRGIHAFFFRLIREVNAAAAEMLHGAREKPFTLSPLIKAPKGDGYCLRVTGFAPGISSLLAGLELKDIPRLEVRGNEYRPTGIFKSPEEHSWARESSFEELYNEGLLWARAQRENLIGLEFLTPTAFRMVNSRLNMPLPWPRLVFGSLANKWNAFCPFSFWINWDEFEKKVTVAGLKVHSVLLEFREFRQVGFVGKCWFLVDIGASLPLRQALYSLSRFAFYCGVGRKATMGMGMAFPLPSGKRITGL